MLLESIANRCSGRLRTLILSDGHVVASRFVPVLLEGV